MGLILKFNQSLFFFFTETKGLNSIVTIALLGDTMPNWYGKRQKPIRCPDCLQREVSLKTLVGDSRFLICPICQTPIHKSHYKELLKQCQN